MGSRSSSRCLRSAGPPADAEGRATHQSPPGAVTRASGGSPTFEPFSFTLPWPLSLNKRFGAVIINGKPRLLLSRASKRDKRVGAVELMMQRVPRRALSCSLVLEIGAVPPRLNRGRDLDNVLKSTLDLLVRHGVLADDRFVDEIHIVRLVPEGDGRLELTVRPRR